MGEAKRRKKLDPNFGKQKLLKSQDRKFYQITPQLIEKVHECQREYQRGFVVIFSQDNIGILPRECAEKSVKFKKFDLAYPDDDLVIINLESVSLSQDKTVVSFPWRPAQIKDGYYQNNKRRKEPSFGKPRLYIAPSPHTNKRMIWIQQLEQVRGISPHYTKESAEYGLSQCQKCLNSFPISHWNQPFDHAYYEFLVRLNEEFPYDDDDEILGVIKSDGEKIYLDSSTETINQATSEINMESIEKTGKRLYTANPHQIQEKVRLGDLAIRLFPFLGRGGFVGLEKELMFVSKQRIFEEKDAFFMKHIDTYDPFNEVLFANYTLHESYGKYEKITMAEANEMWAYGNLTEVVKMYIQQYS